jgi:hypothetical protein
MKRSTQRDAIIIEIVYPSICPVAGENFNALRIYIFFVMIPELKESWLQLL